MQFQLNHVAPGVTHICDGMGVCMTLIAGEKSALLVDTGYGMEDLEGLLRTLAGNKPLRIFLSHHHHDHVLGLRTLQRYESTMLEADAPAFEKYVSLERRKIVFQQANSRGIDVPDAESFLHGAIKAPGKAMPGDIDLGGITARIIPCPGHTPGSAAVLIVEHRILLTCDCWNPCTWCFFDEALPVQEHRRHLQLLQQHDFAHVLCGHQLQVHPRSVFDRFVEGLTDEALRAARPVRMTLYPQIDTREACIADDQVIVFDGKKAGV